MPKKGKLKSPNTRVFNGLRYEPVEWKTKKKDAIWVAKRTRERGDLARMIKVADGYIIYARKK